MFTAPKPADSLEQKGAKGPRGPTHSTNRTTFSGINIVNPPGGKSSISFGGYGNPDISPAVRTRTTESPVHGRRAAPHNPGQKPPPPSLQIPGAHDKDPTRIDRHAQHEPAIQYDRPLPRHDVRSQAHMGGKSIMQAPGGNSSVCLSHPYDNPEAVRRQASQGRRAAASPSMPEQSRSSPSHYVHGVQHLPVQGIHNQPSQGRSSRRNDDGHGYYQDPFGGKNITQAPGGNSSINLSWKTPEDPTVSRSRAFRGSYAPESMSQDLQPPQQANSYMDYEGFGAYLQPSAGHDNHSTKQQGCGYAQDPFGGKRIVQAPGGASSISLGWDPPDAPHRRTAAQSYYAPGVRQPVSSAGNTVGCSSLDGKSSAQRPPLHHQAGMVVPQLLSYGASPVESFSGLNIVNPPGGRQTLNIFGS